MLVDWLHEDSDAGQELRDEALLRIFFTDAIGPRGRAIAAAASARHRRIVAALEDVEHDLDPPRGPRAVLNFGLDYHRWCVDRFAQLAQELEE